VIVDWATYKLVTGDAITAEATALANLARAQRRAEDATGRLFDKVERTETLPIIDGKVWPSAYPVVSVSVPSTATVDASALSISTGVTDLADVYAEVFSERCPWAADRSYLLVTYIGGYELATAPVGLVDAICEIAQRYSMPANTVGVPAGATSVQVGGQSYSGGTLGGSGALPLSIRNTLTKFQHIAQRMAD
jgi:hypothetical protein